jgi:regulator of sigma E protease
MNLVIGLLAFLFMISVIIIIHELGHFLVARSFGVYCHEFSMGMGPAIYQKKGKETTLSIRAIPLGGYVMMAGDEADGDQGEEQDWLKDVPQERRLNNKKTWQQICVMGAGVTMNFILAAFIFIGLSLAKGYIVEEAKPIVYEITEGSAADFAGLQVDDQILSATIDGNTIEPQTQYDLYEFIQYYHGEGTFTVLRDGQEIELTMTPDYDAENQVYVLGYTAIAYAKKANFFELVKAGWDDMIDTGLIIFRSFGMLLKGKGFENMSGPVGIMQVTTKTAAMGLSSYLSLFAMICLNIGIFNLLPIPALDGGRIVILAIERLFNRKINQKFVENIIMASFLLLFGLMIFATYNDILRLFQ